MRCSHCGAENEAEPNFCSECGAKFVPMPDPVQVGDEPGLYYCYKHKREQTRVTCGRCGRPICTRCIVMGPAGVRCRHCAKGNVGLRPRGLLHDLGAGIQGLFSSLSRTPGGYWMIYILITILLSGAFCGRHGR